MYAQHMQLRIMQRMLQGMKEAWQTTAPPLVCDGVCGMQ